MININRLNQNNNYNLGNPRIDRKYSSFLMRETNQSSGNVGKVIPFFWHECQPSEIFRAYSNVNIEFTPWITNILHEINAEITYNFVPYRIIWEDWKKFITRCDEDNDETGGTLEIPLPNYTLGEYIKKGTETKRKYFANNGDIKKEHNDLTDYLFSYYTNNFNFTDGTEKITNFNYFINNLNYLLRSIYNLTYTLTGDVNKDTIIGLAFTDSSREKDGVITVLVNEILNETILDYAGIQTKYDASNLWSLAIYNASNNNNLPNGFQPIQGDLTEGERIKEEVFINKLNFWAYNKIYNDWIRLLDWEERRDKDDLSCATENKAWDIYTKMRRYQIRGAMPTVPVGLSFDAVTSFADINVVNSVTSSGGNREYASITNEANTVKIAAETSSSQSGNVVINKKAQITGTAQIEGSGEWEIQSMMSAAALMNYFVSNAKIKPRYAEQLLARWGVQIQDSRFQYAQMIGAHRVVITQDGITQTAPQVGESTLQGNITGQGWGSGNGEVKFYAPEHGVIIGCLCVKPSNVYELGIQKMWQHENTFDYPTPEFVDLPDQPIKASELGYHATNITLGYKSIYDEYRTKVNRVTGKLRPSLNSGLKAHTLAIDYSEILKTEQNGFIKNLVKADFPMDRIKQFIDEPDFMFISAVNINSTQPLPAQNDVRIRI